MAKRERSSGPGAAGKVGSYTVLARRWRPQQFDELVGQEAIAQALRGAIKAGRVAHAYLFTGARGVGKTSTARILAKALNCRRGPTCQPCDECEICESVAAGDDVDVLEIDGASNRGIDEVRELRQNVLFRPTRARYKVYIIDEVHMLTREAFNALLKTLEEPPPHVKFIFATTDPQRIPVTILSRCQRFDFRGIPPELIGKRLSEIVAAEGIEVDAEVVELLARRAAGSMRDAQSLLDQLLAFGTGRITAEQVHRLLGTAGEDRVVELVDSLLRQEAGAAIKAVDQAEAEGVQLGALIDQLLDYFRDLTVAASAGGDAQLLGTSPRYRDRLVVQSSSRSLHTLLAAADILAETKGRLRGSEHGRVLLDIALVRIAYLEELEPIQRLLERVQKLERGGQAAGSAEPVAASKPASKRVKKNDAVREPSPAADGLYRREPVSELGAGVAPDERVRQAARGLSPVVAEAVARAQIETGADRRTLLVHLDPMYNGASRVKEIQAALQERVGTGLRVFVDVRKKAAEAESAGRTPGRRTYIDRRNEAANDALVRQAAEVLGARLIRVHD